MMLTNPEARRGLRAIVQGLGALAGIALLAWIVDLSEGHPSTLYMIAMGLIGIAMLRELFYGGENVTRAIKFSLSKTGISADMGADEAADVVAGAAVGAAEQVKGAGQ